MSEAEHRRRLNDLMSHETNGPDLQTFLESLSASNEPLAKQLGRVLDADATGSIMPGPYVVAMLKIHELAPAMIRHFRKINYDSFEEVMAGLIGHLDHEDITPFFLTLLQRKSYWRWSLLASLERRKWHADMLGPALEIAQDTTEDAKTRQAAIRLIASQPDKTVARSLLLPFLHDSNSEIRLHTLIHIKDLGDMSLAHHVEPFLFDNTIVGTSTVGKIARLILDTWARKST